MTDYQRFLLGECVEAYLPLDEESRPQFDTLVANEPNYKGVKGMNATSFENGLDKGLDKGLAHVQKLVLRLASKRLGPPEGATQQLFAAIKDLDRLDRIFDRLTDAPGLVSGWDDLLATP